MTHVPDPPCLQMVTPLGPLPTGIAQYSRDLLTAVDGRWRVRVVAEPGSATIDGSSTIDVRVAGRRPRVADLPTIYQLGNSAFHSIAFASALRQPGIAVLHDTVLHHGRLAAMLRGRGGGGDYRGLMRSLYGDAGEQAARDITAGRRRELADFPLIEDLVSASRLVIVHSEYARRQILERVPAAHVHRVPMGIPLPALVPRDDARRALGLPESAFVVASVTHVNPNKRLPIVLRALRLLRSRIPELVLVVAGSVAPGIDLARQAAAYGVADRVRLLGYVSDAEARLVARAADVCVNLRYPSAGETSASLLRLLGAGRPVLVTNDMATAEYPREAVLPVDVVPSEDELVAELLHLLYESDGLRATAGDAARQFIEANHGVGRMAAGYRHAVQAAYGIALAPVMDVQVHEPVPAFERRAAITEPPAQPSDIDQTVAGAARWLAIDGHDDTMRRVAAAMVSLHLNQLRHARKVTDTMAETPTIRPELLEILACPACKAKVRLENGELVCEGCGRRYPIEDGIPIMLVEAAK